VIVVYAISLCFPSEVKVNYTEHIYSSPQDVFEQFNTIRNWENWSVWNSRVLSYSEVLSGPGAYFTWMLKKEGDAKGKLEIIDVQDNERVQLRVRTHPVDSIITDVVFKSVKNGTDVNWSTTIVLKGSIERWLGFFLKRWLVRDVKISLRNLNPYFLQSGQHTGWTSGYYGMSEPMKSRVYFIKDTLMQSSLDSIYNLKFHLLLASIREEYNFEPKSFFYKKISDLESGYSEYMFGTGLDDKFEMTDNTKDLFTGYLSFGYVGSSKGLGQVDEFAYKVSLQENLEIDSLPFVVFHKFPLKVKSMADTSSLIISYPIIGTRDD